MPNLSTMWYIHNYCTLGLRSQQMLFNLEYLHVDTSEKVRGWGREHTHRLLRQLTATGPAGCHYKLFSSCTHANSPSTKKPLKQQQW